ncbi:MAG: hypothetical protein ACK55Z_33770, partial [bacterium]
MRRDQAGNARTADRHVARRHSRQSRARVSAIIRAKDVRDLPQHFALLNSDLTAHRQSPQSRVYMERRAQVHGHSDK